MKISRTYRARTVTAVSLSAVLALTATACGDDGSGGSGSEGSGKGEITLWDNNTGERREIWAQIIKDFEKENPDIKVKYVGIPIDQVQAKYDTAIDGGGLPDVGGVGTAYLSNLVVREVLDPVGDRVQDGALKGKLVPALVDSVKAAGGRGDEMYSVPTSTNNGTLWYRSDMFADAGLEPPATWSAFYEAAEKLTKPGSNQFGYTIRGGAGSIAPAMDAMYGQSGITSFWNGDKTTVNDPRNVAALEKYVALYKKVTPSADVNNDFIKMVAQFDNGSIGMLTHNLASYQDHVKALGPEKFKGLPYPAQENGTRVQVSNPVDGLGLFKGSKNKAAAWKLIEFAASHKSNSAWNESAGSIPANTDAATDDWVRKAVPTATAMKALSDGTTKIVNLPYYLPDWNTISKSGNEPNFQKVLLGDMTAKEFADKLAKELNEAQAEWKEQTKS
ncbi:sugar ABC transporter substrate-binding protein [Streptomyces hebeiensis]|uniref:Sugar ABC transporter substrate-binding protein n=1 Tax=Streptomyces hebeiensis TaxID=229486 RepID=A0ABN1UPR6_9ACTN